MYQHQSQGPGREGLLEGSHSITRLQGRTGRKRNEVATYSFHLQGQVGGQLWAQLNKHPLSSIFSMHPTPQKEKKRVFLTRVRKKGVILVVAERLKAGNLTEVMRLAPRQVQPLAHPQRSPFQELFGTTGSERYLWGYTYPVPHSTYCKMTCLLSPILW